MNNKEIYTKPKMDVIELELENTMAFSNNLNEVPEYNGVSNSRKRDFWTGE